MFVGHLNVFVVVVVAVVGVVVEGQMLEPVKATILDISIVPSTRRQNWLVHWNP